MWVGTYGQPGFGVKEEIFPVGRRPVTLCVVDAVGWMGDGQGTTLIEIAAATLTTAAFVPQVVRVWRTRSAEDLSFGMLGVFIVGLCLWLVYGIRARMVPVVVANAVTLALNLAILVLKVRHRRR